MSRDELHISETPPVDMYFKKWVIVNNYHYSESKKENAQRSTVLPSAALCPACSNHNWADLYLRQHWAIALLPGLFQIESTPHSPNMSRLDSHLCGVISGMLGYLQQASFLYLLGNILNKNHSLFSIKVWHPAPPSFIIHLVILLLPYSVLLLISSPSSQVPQTTSTTLCFVPLFHLIAKCC